jgi:CDP-paratose 2-epimerase
MKILVTGALGFVGVNLCMHFARDKNNVVIGIDNKFKHTGIVENQEILEKNKVIFHYCDIRNQNDVSHLYEQYKGFDIVLHMAAQVAFKNSVENPRLDFEVNLLGTFNLLEATRQHCFDAIFINASTNQVYGELKNEVIKEYDKRFDFVKLKNGVPESYQLDFLSPYGCSKGGADMYVQDYARIYSMNTVVARFGGIYGINQYSYEEHGWVSYIAGMILSKQKFNRFGHGKQVRDILYISDIVNAMVKIIENISSAKGQVFNIAGGVDNSISVLELLDLAQEITGNIEMSIENPMRKADKIVMYLDVTKAKNILGWQPLVGKHDGINMLLDWLKKRAG